MKKTVDVSKEVNDMRKFPANKKCFECGEIGTTYIVPDFGVFVCSICAGIHREFNHRVKGLSMSNFSQAELDLLKTQGNEACQRTWMARYNPRDFPQPSPKETQRIKDFIRLKYRERRWYQDVQAEASATQQTSVESREAAPVPGALSRPVIPAPQQATFVGDLLSMGETPSKPAPTGDGWADFTPPPTNQVNIQISFQQPKPEDRKPVEPTPPTNPVQVQVRQMQPAYPEAKKDLPVQAPQPTLPTYQPAPIFQPQQEKPVAVPMSASPGSYAQTQPAYPNPAPTYPIYQPQAKDPFSGLVESDMAARPAASKPAFDMRVLQQQYYVQSQTYTQIYGVQYPYTFQVWCQVLFPKPQSVTSAPQPPPMSVPQPTVPVQPPVPAAQPRSKSNNPFDMFG
jgi:hypothetical protein